MIEDYGNALVVKSNIPTREQAIKWWNNIEYKRAIMSKHYKIVLEANKRDISSLTGREIEEILMKETQQEPERGIIINVGKEPQVDFPMLNQTLSFDIESPKLNDYFLKEELHNLKLFFQLLSTKPTFASRAFKELNKLNK